MAVTFSTSVNLTAATTTNSKATLSVGGSNTTIIAAIGISSATAVVSSGSWSLGGTASLVSSSRSAGNVLVSIWAVPAPTGGSGTYTAGYSASAESVGVIACYTGADQTSPAVSADAVTSVSVSSNINLVPNNLTASDASELFASNTVTGNWTSTTPSQISSSNASNPGWIAGRATGVTGVHEFNDGTCTTNDVMIMAVRIKAAAAGGTALGMITPAPLDVGSGNRFFGNRVMKELVLG